MWWGWWQPCPTLQPLSDHERVPAHQPTTLSATFAGSTIASLSPLDAYSIPQVPPSLLWGVKGAPLLLPGEWGTWGPRQRTGSSPLGFHCQPWYSPRPLPFRLCCSLLRNCTKAPSGVWHGYSSLGVTTAHAPCTPVVLPEEVGRAELLHWGRFSGCSTLPFC